jgi:hypothetical protein
MPVVDEQIRRAQLPLVIGVRLSNLHTCCETLVAESGKRTSMLCRLIPVLTTCERNENDEQHQYQSCRIIPSAAMRETVRKHNEVLAHASERSRCDFQMPSRIIETQNNNPAS